MRFLTWDCSFRIDWRDRDNPEDVSGFLNDRIREFNEKSLSDKRVSTLYEYIQYQAISSFENLNCHVRISNYRQDKGSLIAAFTLICSFSSVFITYGSLRQSVDYFLKDLETIIGMIDPQNRLTAKGTTVPTDKSLFKKLKFYMPVTTILCLFFLVVAAIIISFESQINKQDPDSECFRMVKVAVENEFYKNSHRVQIDERLKNLEKALKGINQELHGIEERNESQFLYGIEPNLPPNLLQELNVFVRKIQEYESKDKKMIYSKFWPHALILAEKVVGVAAPLVEGTKQFTADIAHSFLEKFAESTGEVTPKLIADLIRYSIEKRPNSGAWPNKSRFIYFDFGSTELTSSGKSKLNKLCDSGITTRSRIQLIGSADRSGDANLNRKLATARIQTVREHLLEYCIDVDFINSKILIENAAPIPTSDGTKEPENRRVEVRIKYVGQ